MSDFRDLIHDPKCRPRFEKLLRLAASRGDARQVRERLGWGIDPNSTTPKGRTPLIINVRGCSPSFAVVQALLEAGSDPTHLDFWGLTALDYARRKLLRLNMKPRRSTPKSPSLDENNQVILEDFEQEMFDQVRRDHPEHAREFITDYLRERKSIALKVYNDPDEVERIIDFLEEAVRRQGS